jgi:hypothetical protein
MMRPGLSNSLESATDAPAIAPVRWWLLWGFGGMVAGNVLNVRLTPPGWPVASDYVLMALIPIGGLVMGLWSRAPGWVIGLYGMLGAATFYFFGQLLLDGRLGLRLSGHSGEIRQLAVNWGLFFLGSWVFCRGCVGLRRERR